MPAFRSAKPWRPWKRPGGRSTVRVVLDANVLVSAVFGGLPARAIERAMREEVWNSPDVRKEWTELVARLGKKLSLDAQMALKAKLVAIQRLARVIPVTKPVRLSRDPADDAYLALARAAKANVLLTGDDDLFALSRRDLEREGLTDLAILSPRDFLRRYPA